MSSISSSTREFESPSRRELALYHLRRNPLVAIGLIIATVWIVIAFIAPSIAPVEPLKQDLVNRLLAPGEQFSMGSDELGRDIFSRVLWGSRITIPAGLAVIIMGSTLGVIIGAIAGYAGGLVDELLMRLTELFMAFPFIILAMAVTAALGPDIRNAVLALAAVWWPRYARILRGLVLEVKSKEFVEAAHSAGAGSVYVLFRTILPNCIAPAVILATLDIGTAILSFAALSFIGLGPEPSSPEWGRMVSIGIDFFDQWWMWLFPGVAIASLVMAFNFIGDGMRDILDPRLRGE
ncbi:MAG: ABC transporter permease [Chloroflexi bacterium]|nr:ABC transporter permease [Chloroflexota bacterium]